MPNGDPLIIGKINTGALWTTLKGSYLQLHPTLDVSPVPPSIIPPLPAAAINGSSDLYSGVYGYSEKQDGVAGWTRAPRHELINWAGVSGMSSKDGFGVCGEHLGPNTSGGVTGTGAAVAAFSRYAIGVFANTTGDFGWSPGVLGISRNYHGVIGSSLKENGVYGFGTNGVVGECSKMRDPNLFGVFAWGQMGCTGPKCAAVPYKNGQHQLLYSVESPESWFEDFGSARLVRGRAKVAIPRDFAPLVRTNRYHVFITPEGDCKGLFVARKSSSGFEVRELLKGTSSIAFAYRIVARRKDVDAPRLQKVNLRLPSKDMKWPDAARIQRGMENSPRQRLARKGSKRTPRR